MAYVSIIRIHIVFSVLEFQILRNVFVIPCFYLPIKLAEGILQKYNERKKELYIKKKAGSHY